MCYSTLVIRVDNGAAGESSQEKVTAILFFKSRAWQLLIFIRTVHRGIKIRCLELSSGV